MDFLLLNLLLIPAVNLYFVGYGRSY